MKSFLPLLSLALIVTSCTTAYNSGQTPDDLYFSPERPQNEYVRVENKQKKYRYEESDDDRYLRMKVRNRRMWSDLSYYYNDPIAYDYYYHRYHNSYYGGSPWNYYNSWNYYYNPYSNYNRHGYTNYYGSPVIVVNPKTPSYNRPRRYNLDVYNNPAPTGSSPRVNSSSNRRVFSNSGSGSSGQPSYSTPSSNTGSNLRNVFSNSNSSSSSSSNSKSEPTRMQSSNTNTNTNTNSSSSSSSGSSRGGNAGARKF